VQAWSPVKSHSLHSCFWWSVNGLFITSSTYSCVIFPLQPKHLCAWYYQ
jgi:hypothetical protein